MNDGALFQFRELARALSERPKVKVEITLKNERVLSALYDPMFKTFTIGGSTFPGQELSTWTKLGWGSEVSSIIAKTFNDEASEKKSPVLSQAEN